MLAKEFDQRLAPRPAPTAVGGPPPWIAGRQWSDLRLRQPGWLLLPLRMFLAVTFVYAGLQKIANPAYLDAHNRSSVVGQMQYLRHISPIGPLLGLSMHAPTLVGVLIAFGELAVGGQVQIGEQLMPFPEPVVLRRYGLLYLDDQVGAGEHLVGSGDDGGAGRGVIDVGEAGSVAGAGFHQHLVPVVDQLRDAVGLDGDPILVVLNFFGDADDKL